jgi:hypothetical protein
MNGQNKNSEINKHIDKIKVQLVPLVELKCQPSGEELHTFKTDRVYLMFDKAGKERELGFAICPLHNLEVSIIPMRTKSSPAVV